MQDICYPEIDPILLIMKEIFYGITLVPKQYQLYTFLKIKNVIKESPYSTKIKYILLIHSQDEHIFGTRTMWISSMWIRKQPQRCTIKSRRR